MIKSTRILLIPLMVMILILTIFVSVPVSSGTGFFPSKGVDIQTVPFDRRTVSSNSDDDVYSNKEQAELRLYNYERTARMQEAIRDISSQELLTRPDSPEITYNMGDNETFWVADDYLIDYVAENWAVSMYEVTAEVVSITTHAYIFKDPTVSVSDTKINTLAATFESTLYPVETEFFGAPPDIDSNGRIIILILDIKDANYYGHSSQWIAGYFWSLHTYYPSGNPSDLTYYSEYKEIIHIDYRSFAENIDQDTVAHEYQHLLHFNSDNEETAWLDEGCAVLAEYLCGYTDGWLPYIDGVSGTLGFMDVPSTSLTYWQNGFASYGAVFSFMLMIQQVFGNSTIKAIVTDDAQQGMVSVEDKTGSDAKDLFAEFTYWNVINDVSKGYGYGVFTTKAVRTSLSSLPAFRMNEYVPYWATKYYTIPNGGTGTLNLTVTGLDGVNITADILVMNQSGMYEVFNVKNKGPSKGEFLLNSFGMEYSNAILVVYSMSGTDSGWEAITAPKDYFNIEINLIPLEIYHGSINYEKTSYSETIVFNNITVIDTLTGNRWILGDVINTSNAIIDRDTEEEISNVTGVVQWNDTYTCWQASFDDVSDLEPGFYYVKVTLTTINATAVIKSDPFEIIRPTIVDEGSGSFKDGVIKYSGIKIGYSNGTIWPSTASAMFQLFYENDSLIFEAALLWDGKGQSWYLPVISAGFEPGDRVYLVFEFEYAGESLTFQSEELENKSSSTPVIDGFIISTFLAVFAFMSLYVILNRKQKWNK
ncbi:MAG: hypothetical protein ACFFD4_10205 [Candidatus Odinarchaeota archaeon]